MSILSSNLLYDFNFIQVKKFLNMGFEKLPSLLTTKHLRNLLRPEKLKKFDENFRLIEANPGQQFRESYKKYDSFYNCKIL